MFMHWPVPVALLRPLIPARLEVDTYEGMAWIGVVPFLMRHVRARNLPEMPATTTFPELNVRTYVREGDRSGVWFFSLDADHWPAVIFARQVFRLPYHKAAMRIDRQGERVIYSSIRRHPGMAAGEFRGEYGPTSAVRLAAVGSLEYFLTERYYLYAADRAGRVYRAAVQHLPWPLQDAEAEIAVNSVASSLGLELADTPPLLHYAGQVDVLTWGLERV
jgi:uncharacterized protein YqjF (DUF2071 family)